MDIRIYPKEIMQQQMPLVVFNGNVTMSMGTMEGVIILTNFVILNTSTSYNVILGRTYIHKMRVIPSTYQQLIKYPTIDRIKELRGEQENVRSCYISTMKSALPFGSK